MQNTIEQINKALSWRAGTKIFSDRKLEEDKLEAILEAGRMAPGAYGLQPYKFIHIEDKTLRDKIKEAAYGQAKVTDSSELFVIVARTDIDENFVNEYIQNISKTRGVPVSDLEEFKKTMVGDITTRTGEGKFAWAGRQAYISFGFMLETAALLQVDAGPMEGFNPQKVDEILNLKDRNLTSLGLVSFGYRGDDVYSTLKKVRVSKEDLILKM